MRLYHRGAAFCKKMRGKLRKMSEKRNIRDHKRRFLAAKYELRRKLFKAFCKDFLVICGTNIVISRPRSVYELFQIYRIVFRGIKKSYW